MPEPALLVLEDGRIFRGESFGARRSSGGEVVFSTSMTGYQEMCTDPSYHGQILCLTYPLIGNYGISPAYQQSVRPWVSGLVVRDLAPYPSHWDSSMTLDQYLREAGVPGICGVDTRALTRHIRSLGARRGIIVSGEETSLSPEELTARARRAPVPADLPGVAEVSLGRRYTYELSREHQFRVAVIDCGLKTNILRSLAERPVEAVVVPYSATPGEIFALDVDGVITSPGPGDPQQSAQAVETVGAVLDRNLPFFGICLGHQILGLAIGATTSKLKFGHRGGNHPVKEAATGRIYITSQNHGYQVDRESVPLSAGWRVSHSNVNDGSVEGLVHAERPAFSVQYHPEGSPGPEDSARLFDDFLRLMRTKRAGREGQSA